MIVDLIALGIYCLGFVISHIFVSTSPKPKHLTDVLILDIFWPFFWFLMLVNLFYFLLLIPFLKIEAYQNRKFDEKMRVKNGH